MWRICAHEHGKRNSKDEQAAQKLQEGKRRPGNEQRRRCRHFWEGSAPRGGEVCPREVVSNRTLFGGSSRSSLILGTQFLAPPHAAGSHWWPECGWAKILLLSQQADWRSVTLTAFPIAPIVSGGCSILSAATLALWPLRAAGCLQISSAQILSSRDLDIHRHSGRLF